MPKLSWRTVCARRSGHTPSTYTPPLCCSVFLLPLSASTLLLPHKHRMWNADMMPLLSTHLWTRFKCTDTSVTMHGCPSLSQLEQCETEPGMSWCITTPTQCKQQQSGVRANTRPLPHAHIHTRTRTRCMPTMCLVYSTMRSGVHAY